MLRRIFGAFFYLAANEGFILWSDVMQLDLMNVRY